MLFDEERLQPTYEFRYGLPGASYAFPVARRIGLSDAVLERAAEILGVDRAAADDLIAKLSDQHLELADRLRAAEEMTKEADVAEKRYRKAVRKVESESGAVRARAIAEAEQLVSEANSRIERTIREIKEAQAARAATRVARRDFESYRDQLSSRVEEVAQPSAGVAGSIEVGDQVVIDDGGATGDVVEFQGREAVVAFESGRVRVRRDRLRRVGGQSRDPRPRGRLPSLALQARVHLNVRGLRVDEALSQVERFVDEGIAGGAGRLEILHGKGTGALRAAIREYLDGRDDVQHARDAEWNEGGAGVTVVKV